MKKKKVNKNKIIIEVETDLDNALGSAHRDQYLQENPDGFRKVHKVHKNKKKYSRKQKHSEPYK